MSARGPPIPGTARRAASWPRPSSWEPVRTLKNDPQTRDIPIIGMSAYALDSEREKAIATGCDEFDIKPIEFESLLATIRRVVANPK